MIPSNPQKEIKNLKPFTRFCCTIGELPTSYLISMTYEEQLLWLCNYLENTVIPAVNNNAEALEEVQKLYSELRSYVDNYFSELNVQEEINNKLDEMAEDGTLDEIINQNIFAELNHNLETEIENRQNADNILHNENLELNTKITKIKNMLSNYNIQLTNNIIYDMLNGRYNQGMTIDEYGNMYVYEEIDNIVGNLLVFNINNYTLVRTISNVQLYHGGDLVIKGDFLYSIANYVNMTIIKYNLRTSERTELNPFLNISETQTLGLADFDENNLLCLTGHLIDGESNIHDFATCKLYKVNINSWQIEEIPITNTKGYKLDYYCFQSMEYFNNKLYVLCSYPNMILELQFNEDLETFNIEKIYNIPEYDVLGQKIGEMQGISLIRTNTYGENSFMLTTVIPDYNVNTLKSYVFNFNTELQNPLSRFDIQDASLYRNLVVVDSQANQYVFYENGSEAYPFKTIRRALSFANYSPVALGKQLKVYSGHYYIGTISFVDGVIGVSDAHSGSVNFDGSIQAYNSNLTFIGASSIDLNINVDARFDNCKVHFRECTFTDVVRFSYTEATILDCNFTDTDRQYIIVCQNQSKVISSAATFSNENAYYYINRYAVLFVNDNVPDEKIVKQDKYFIIRSN